MAGHKGFIVSQRAREYPETEPQRVMRKIVEKCGIKKGITKAELQRAMRECVGPLMREYYKK